MTVSKETAFELGVTANANMVMGQAAAHAGLAISTWAIANIALLDTEGKKAITHVIEHLAEIQKVATVIDEYTDEKLEMFGIADRQGMVEVSKAIGASDILRKLQEAVGMSEEEIAKQIAVKEAEQVQYANEGN